MDRFGSPNCQRILLLQSYRHDLLERRIKITSHKKMAAPAATWVSTVAKAGGISAIREKEEAECFLLAQEGYRARLVSKRFRCVTARILLATGPEVCEWLAALAKDKDLTGLLSTVYGVTRFYDWLHEAKLIHRNHFRETCGRVERELPGFLMSLRDRS